MGATGHRLGTAVQHALGRARAWWWPVVQQALAAGAAWLIALPFAAQHQPFFAPIAAIIALNTQFGQRGRQAVNVLIGVFLGIAVGELAVLLLPGVWLAIIAATLVSMLLAAAAGGDRITLGQAGASAVITATVAVGTPQPLGRLGDAVIGVVVALLISQVLFPPRPLRLVHRVEDGILADLSHGLDLTAGTLRGDDDGVQDALDRMRSATDQLGDLITARRASDAVTRHSLTWRRERERVRAERAASEHLDDVVLDGMTAVRGVLALRPDERRKVAATLETLGSVLGRFAEGPAARADLRLRDAARPDRTPADTGGLDVLEDNAGTGSRRGLRRHGAELLDRLDDAARGLDAVDAKTAEPALVAVAVTLGRLVEDTRVYVRAKLGLEQDEFGGSS